MTTHEAHEDDDDAEAEDAAGSKLHDRCRHQFTPPWLLWESLAAGVKETPLRRLPAVQSWAFARE